jgi:hypothetical protein
MKSSTILRTAIVVTAAAAVGTVAIILALVAAVSSGALPNPAVPLGGSHPVKDAPRVPVPVVFQPAPQSPPSPPVPSATRVETPPSHRQPPSETPSHAPTPSENAKAPVPQAKGEGDGERSSPETSVSPADRLAAVRLLRSTNDLPVVRVEFRPEDLLSLARSGRGAIIAGYGLTNRREISVSIAGGDIQPLDRTVAQKISRFRLPSGSLPLPPSATPLLRAYFPQGFEIEYGLSHSDAEEIIAKVFAAGRSHADFIRPRLVYEGILSLGSSGRVEFKVLRVGEREVGI